jgi:hypothetical protein
MQIIVPKIGFRVQGSGFKGSEVLGSGFKGSEVLGSGFRVQRFGGSGFKVQGSVQPLAAEVYPPQEGGQFDRIRN